MIKAKSLDIFALFCALLLAFVTFSSFAYADDTSDSPPFTVTDYDFDGWQSAPTNLNKLAEVFVSTLKSSSASDFFVGFVSDIPRAWVKLINDSSYLYSYCICPLDDVYYYLDNDGNLCIYDPHNRTGRSGGAGYNRYVSSSDDYIFNSQFFKTRIDYWHDYYKPKDKSPTASRIYWTTQSSDVPEGFQSHLTNGDFDMPLFCTSTNKNGFLGLDWSDLYLLPYVEKADSNGLSQYYYGRYTWHFYIARDDGNLPYLQLDVISLDTSEVSASYTFLKSSTDYPFSTYSNLRFRSNFSTTYYAGQLKGFTSYLDMIAGDMSFTQPESFYKDLFTSYSSLYSGSISSLSSYSFNSSTLSSSSDFGYICQNEMFELWSNDTSIDTSKIPDDYVVTVTGDTVYDYSITNTAGDTSTINNYITNNYSIPSSGSGSDSGSVSGSSDGSVSGNVTVSGDIGVNGSVDINLNVNQSSGSNIDLDDPDLSDVTISHWYDWLSSSTSDLSSFLSDFFGWLPGGLVTLLCVSIAGVCLCRFLGR